MSISTVNGKHCIITMPIYLCLTDYRVLKQVTWNQIFVVGRCGKEFTTKVKPSSETDPAHEQGFFPSPASIVSAFVLDVRRKNREQLFQEVRAVGSMVYRGRSCYCTFSAGFLPGSASVLTEVSVWHVSLPWNILAWNSGLSGLTLDTFFLLDFFNAIISTFTLTPHFKVPQVMRQWGTQGHFGNRVLAPRCYMPACSCN